MRRTLAIAGLGLAAAAVAQVGPLPRFAPVELPTTVTPVAIVYTAEEGAERVEVEAWDEEGPSMAGLIGARIDYFTVEPATIELRVGQRFDLRLLAIEAHGLDGGLLGGAPLELELEAPDGMLDLALATTNREIAARAPGIARLWIEAALPRGTGTGEHYRLPVVIIVN